MEENTGNIKEKSRYLSPFSAWALSFGSAVGWGAFVMPGTLFLPSAGPVGTALGMILGAAVMIIIGYNYRYMMMKYPGNGSTFTYARKTFGNDHGFLCAWFMILMYVAVLWANITALVMILRNFFGESFMFGFHYSIAGYDVYLGEILLQIGVLLAAGLLCAYAKKAAGIAQTVMAAVLIAGIITVFAVCTSNGDMSAAVSPAFATGKNIPLQIINVVAMAPWAFVGFESVSNSSKEFRFPVKKSFGIMAAGVVTAFAAYVMLNFAAISARPAEYAGWESYVSDIGSLSGVKSMPVFYAVEQSFGQTGMVILAFTILGAILTGIIGSFIAASRLLFSMADKGIFSKKLAVTDKNGSPARAVIGIMLISLAVPFIGRTAIGWVVDATTVSAAIAYAYTSAAAFKTAKDAGNKKAKVLGMIGMVMSAAFGLFLLVPSLFSEGSMSEWSYFLLAAWGILGIIFFRFVFNRDKDKVYGRSTVVWIALLFLIFFSSIIWMRQDIHAKTNDALSKISDHYTEEIQELGAEYDAVRNAESREYLVWQMTEVHNSLIVNSVLQMALIMLSIVIIFSIYNDIRKRENETEAQKIKAEESSKAKSVFLSNMSHDIRTPMNAIMGYIALSKYQDVTEAQLREYLAKIESSGQHLLALINDVLEMSRIESGKMELETVPTDLRKLMDSTRDMFMTQMQGKNIKFTVECTEIENRGVLCDKNRINRVLLNLISNAYKFTPENGSVTVTLRQVTETPSEDGTFGYELKVRDSGIGMTEEFAAKVFEAFERERTSTVSGIQGTGLGMAITKSIVDLMKGSITVDTAPGKGTCFTVRLDLEPCAELETKEKDEPKTGGGPDFGSMRLLLVDDVMMNREIAKKILTHMGFAVETAENGQEAVDKVTGAQDGYYDGVLMDIQMPVMDGYDATKAIRAAEDGRFSKLPIIAMTANAFNEDVQKAQDAGMDGHIAKPIDIQAMTATLKEILGREQN